MHGNSFVRLIHPAAGGDFLLQVAAVRKWGRRSSLTRYALVVEGIVKEKFTQGDPLGMDSFGSENSIQKSLCLGHYSHFHASLQRNTAFSWLLITIPQQNYQKFSKNLTILGIKSVFLIFLEKFIPSLALVTQEKAKEEPFYMYIQYPQSDGHSSNR